MLGLQACTTRLRLFWARISANSPGWSWIHSIAQKVPNFAILPESPEELGLQVWVTRPGRMYSAGELNFSRALELPGNCPSYCWAVSPAGRVLSCTLPYLHYPSFPFDFLSRLNKYQVVLCREKPKQTLNSHLCTYGELNASDRSPRPAWSGSSLRLHHPWEGWAGSGSRVLSLRVKSTFFPDLLRTRIPFFSFLSQFNCLKTNLTPTPGVLAATLDT